MSNACFRKVPMSNFEKLQSLGHLILMVTIMSCHKSMDTPPIVNSEQSNKVKATQLAAMICPLSSACIKCCRHAYCHIGPFHTMCAHCVAYMTEATTSVSCSVSPMTEQLHLETISNKFFRAGFKSIPPES